MLTHTHVYYSNRFEPGTLFPDTFKIDRGAQLKVLPASIAHIPDIDHSLNFDSFNGKVVVGHIKDLDVSLAYTAFNGKAVIGRMENFDRSLDFIKTGSTVFTSKLNAALDASTTMSATLMYVLVPSKDFRLDEAFDTIANGVSHTMLNVSLQTEGSMQNSIATFITHEVVEAPLFIYSRAANLNVNSMKASYSIVTII